MAQPTTARAGSLAEIRGGLLQRPARERDLARARQIARGERVEQRLQSRAVGAKADDHEACARHGLEHKRPGRQQQVDALADDQLADERHEAIALEVQLRKRARCREIVARERALIGRARRTRARAGASVGRRVRVVRRLAAQPLDQLAHAQSGRATPRAAQSAPRPRPADPAASATPASPRRASATGSARCAASLRAPPPRRPDPRARTPGSARAGALPCTRARCRAPLTAYGTRASQGPREHDGAHHDVVGERDLRIDELRDLAHRTHVGAHVAGDLLV